MVEGAKILERLLAEGKLQREQCDRVVVEARRTAEHAIEVAIDFGFIGEQDVLRFLASMLRTQFVGTDKLAKAQVERLVLEMVNVRVAERLKLFPLLFDRKTHTLSVVTCELDVHDVAKQLSVVTQAREVRCYIARPRAIQALIRRHYYGDASLFRALLSAPKPVVVTDVGIDLGYGDIGSGDSGFDDLAPPKRAAAPAVSASSSIPLPSDFEDIPGLDDVPRTKSAPRMPAHVARAAEPERRAASQPLKPDVPAGIQISAPDFLAGMANVVARPEQPSRIDTPHPRAPTDTSAYSAEAVSQTVNVLVALLEQQRDELRGHSAQVARLVRAVVERMGVTGSAVHELVLAAHLHDVGKSSSYHLTALNVAQYDGHRTQAQRSHLVPVRMFEGASLPASTIAAMGHMYERFDGAGFPDRLTGKEIPLGARVLAAVETYVDVTTTTKNPYRKRLTAAEACEGLARFAGVIFDETVLDVLRLVVLGDEQRARGHVSDKRILIADPDPEESTVLEMRLTDRGFEVCVVRDASGALAEIERGTVGLVVADVELGERDGFWLVERIRAGTHADIPVVFHTRRGDRDSVTRGFELGVVDYVVKPASPEVVAAKIQKSLEAAAAAKVTGPGRGMSGSLREMSLPDVVQLLANGRKSGRLEIESGNHRGEMGFSEGMVFEASFGHAVGEEAVYTMLMLDDGTFSIDSSYVPTRNRVNVSAESLLLEGMRRIDEQRR